MAPRPEEDEEPDLPQYLIPPEVFSQSPAIQAVIGPLRRLAAEVDMAGAEAWAALEELAANPAGLLAFFNFLPPKIVDGKVRRHRGSMVLPPTLTPQSASTHRDLYEEVVRKLGVLRLDDLPASLREPMAMIRSAYVDHLHERYKNEDNPMHCWRAYRFARETECTVPGWVMSYFDRCAASFEKLVEEQPKVKVEKAVAGAVGMSSGKGRGSKLSAVNKTALHKEIYLAVEALISEGLPPGVACAKAQERLASPMNPEAFRQCYYDFKNARALAAVKTDRTTKKASKE